MSIETFNTLFLAIIAGLATLVGALAIWGVTAINALKDRYVVEHKAKMAKMAKDQMIENADLATKAVEQLSKKLTMTNDQKAAMALSIANQFNAATGSFTIAMPAGLPPAQVVMNEAHVAGLPPKEVKGEG